MPSIIKFKNTDNIQYTSFDNAFDEEEVIEEDVLEEEKVIIKEVPVVVMPEAPPPIQESDFDVDGFLQKVREQAEDISKELIDKAREKSQEKAKELCENAENEGREKGYQEGYNEGYSKGYIEAYEKGLKAINQDCDRLLCEIQAGIELFKEEKRLIQEKHLEGMKELAVAIAEKVIAMNLESQSEVIKQMIVTALDNAKATQWIKIHISGFDAERYFEIEQELLESIRHISDFVKVEVVEGADSGTCIIEMPDKIIDASVNTQISNIKGMLNN